ncbi:DNA-processing protein DprA [Aquibaculum sediminis]|uniref:DNA-processing protein DprA n=1 Tax=Aquibaculum sediminis TaxID=3231907 RepID=UPI0034548BB1
MAITTACGLSEAERLARLQLARTENVGPVTFRQLLQRYGSADAALDALPELARRGGRRRPVKLCSREAATREVERLAGIGAQLLIYGDNDYPPPLAAVSDAPPTLSLQGRRDLLDRPALAVVGARNASSSGRSLARHLARDLAAEGLLIVSGLARGIDAAAHEGALDDGTAAILAGGIDCIYPPQNEALHQAIAEQGLLLAELAPGTEPQARHFPRRNRIISGLSRGVLVVEAAPRSGSLITARLAAEQGREVLAVPGSPLDPRARGCNDLLRQGATLVETADDVLQALAGPLTPLREAPPVDFELPEPEETDKNAADSAHRELRELLSPTAVSVDELLRQCQFSGPTVSLALLEMELAGSIERRPGNRVALAAEPG